MQILGDEVCIGRNAVATLIMDERKGKKKKELPSVLREKLNNLSSSPLPKHSLLLKENDVLEVPGDLSTSTASSVICLFSIKATGLQIYTFVLLL